MRSAAAALALAVLGGAAQCARALVIISPSDVAGIYYHVSATFGPALPEAGIYANVSVPIPSDACQTIENAAEVADTIVLAIRGECDFIEKVRKAQAADALAVVVANNEGDHLFKMYSSDEDTSDVTIPSVFVTQNDGNKLPGAYIALNATGEYDFADDNFMHPYFFMAIILLGLSVTLACTLTATLAGYLVLSFKRRRQRNECRRLVSKLKVRKYVKHAQTDPDVDGEEACTICLEEFVNGDQVKVLPCGHEYHRACIDPWLLEKSSLCPLCKQNITAGADLHAAEAQPPSHTEETTTDLLPRGPTFGRRQPIAPAVASAQQAAQM